MSTLLVWIKRIVRVVWVIGIRAAQVEDSAGFEDVEEHATKLFISTDVLQDLAADDLIELEVETLEFVEVVDLEAKAFFGNAKPSIEKAAVPFNFSFLDAHADHSIPGSVALVSEHPVTATGVENDPRRAIA